jgi:hypothetical protein
VTIGGRSGVTGTDGRYHITDIEPVGVYSVTCVAPGWTMPALVAPVHINEGTNNLDDIFLVAEGNRPPSPPSF